MYNILIEYVNFINSYTKENNIKSIDIYNMFRNEILKEYKYYDLYFDGVHLNSEGHNVLVYKVKGFTFIQLYKDKAK